MDDDDFFGDDSFINQREHELRLANNEVKKMQHQLFNQGYLSGLEWAEANYLECELTHNYKDYFTQGMSQGLSKPAMSQLFQQAGILK